MEAEPREGRVFGKGPTPSSFITIFVRFFFNKKCHMKSYHNDIEYQMMLNVIFSVFFLPLGGRDLVSTSIIELDALNLSPSDNSSIPENLPKTSCVTFPKRIIVSYYPNDFRFCKNA